MRFLIPKKERINLVPINILGKIDLDSYEINLNKVYLENESDQRELNDDELLSLQERINEIVLQNSLHNTLKYLNLRKYNFIQNTARKVYLMFLVSKEDSCPYDKELDDVKKFLKNIKYSYDFKI